MNNIKNPLTFVKITGDKKGLMKCRFLADYETGKAGVHNHLTPDMIDHLLPELIP